MEIKNCSSGSNLVTAAKFKCPFLEYFMPESTKEIFQTLPVLEKDECLTKAIVLDNLVLLGFGPTTEFPELSKQLYTSIYNCLNLNGIIQALDYFREILDNEFGIFIDVSYWNQDIYCLELSYKSVWFGGFCLKVQIETRKGIENRILLILIGLFYPRLICMFSNYVKEMHFDKFWELSSQEKVLQLPEKLEMASNTAKLISLDFESCTIKYAVTLLNRLKQEKWKKKLGMSLAHSNQKSKIHKKKQKRRNKKHRSSNSLERGLSNRQKKKQKRRKIRRNNPRSQPVVRIDNNLNDFTKESTEDVISKRDALPIIKDRYLVRFKKIKPSLCDTLPKIDKFPCDDYSNEPQPLKSPESLFVYPPMFKLKKCLSSRSPLNSVRRVFNSVRASFSYIHKQESDTLFKFAVGILPTDNPAIKIGPLNIEANSLAEAKKRLAEVLIKIFEVE